jgi:hypothetical protein
MEDKADELSEDMVWLEKVEVGVVFALTAAAAGVAVVVVVSAVIEVVAEDN